MTTRTTEKMTALAMRREMLIVRCALQRMDAGDAVHALTEPFGNGGACAIPMSITGVLLGLIGGRATRALPMVTAALSLWKLMGSLRAYLRRPPAA